MGGCDPKKVENQCIKLSYKYDVPILYVVDAIYKYILLNWSRK